MILYPKEVEEDLRKAGWYPGRHVEIDRTVQAELLKQSKQILPSAEKFLQEFGGLRIVFLLFDSSFLLRRGSSNLEKYQNLIDEPLQCVGLDNVEPLLIDSSGSLYRVDDDNEIFERCGRSPEEAITNLLTDSTRIFERLSPYSDSFLKNILTTARTIAILGYDDPNDPDRIAYSTDKYLREAGYTVYAIAPHLSEVNGTVCYPSLREVPEPVDIVSICRYPFEHRYEDDVDEAIAIGAKAVWVEFHFYVEAAKEKNSEDGTRVIIAIDDGEGIEDTHKRLIAKNTT